MAENDFQDMKLGIFLFLFSSTLPARWNWESRWNGIFFFFLLPSQRGETGNICFFFYPPSKMSLDGPSNHSQYPGVTGPISLAEPKPFDIELTNKLEESMKPHGVFESEAELAHRWGPMDSAECFELYHDAYLRCFWDGSFCSPCPKCTDLCVGHPYSFSHLLSPLSSFTSFSVAVYVSLSLTQSVYGVCVCVHTSSPPPPPHPLSV